MSGAPSSSAALIGRLTRLEDSVTEIEDPEPELEVNLAADAAADAPVVKLVQSIIAQAVERGASDIHFDPEADIMQVLLRIDGVLQPAATVPLSIASSVISRVKIMADLESQVEEYRRQLAVLIAGAVAKNRAHSHRKAVRTESRRSRATPKPRSKRPMGARSKTAARGAKSARKRRLARK